MPEAIECKPDDVGLFAYGSLLLLSSMERTLGHSYTGPRYVCNVRGWRRRWTSLYPNEIYYFIAAGGRRCYPRNIVYLNIEPGADVLNGLVYIIDRSELPAFDKREAVYDRIIIPRESIDPDFTGPSIYAYVGKPQHVLKQPLPVAEAAIRASYLRMIEEGLAILGPQFRTAYERSSDEASPGSVIDDHCD